jgi:hypothetical protein
MFAFRIAAACGLGLELASECLGGHSILPLAGGNLAQLGLLFGATFIVVELIDTLKEGVLRRLPRRRKRPPKSRP